MRKFLGTLPQNIVQCFSGYNLIFHTLLIVLTVIIVTSGADWWYSLATKSVAPWGLYAGFLGFIVPVLLPLTLLLIGIVRRDQRLQQMAYALAQAALIALLLTYFYKAFTGRAHPELFATDVLDIHTVLTGGVHDISKEFHFGFLRGGVFWGWPSSHAAVAFAGMTTLFLLVRNRAIGYTALLYAFFIALGASVSFHWLSDCIAGAILGTVVGRVVAKSYSDVLPY